MKLSRWPLVEMPTGGQRMSDFNQGTSYLNVALTTICVMYHILNKHNCSQTLTLSVPPTQRSSLRWLVRQQFLQADSMLALHTAPKQAITSLATTILWKTLLLTSCCSNGSKRSYHCCPLQTMLMYVDYMPGNAQVCPQNSLSYEDISTPSKTWQLTTDFIDHTCSLEGLICWIIHNNTMIQTRKSDWNRVTKSCMVT